MISHDPLINGLSSWLCFCLTPTSFTSDIQKCVIFGCPEHEIEFDNSSIYSIDEAKNLDKKIVEALN